MKSINANPSNEQVLRTIPKSEGITTGTGGDFCLEKPATCYQMAAFLVGAFNLP